MILVYSQEHFTPIPITMTLLQYRLQDNSSTNATVKLCTVLLYFLEIEGL